MGEIRTVTASKEGRADRHQRFVGDSADLADVCGSRFVWCFQ
jgi:hypothetical protein